MAMNGAKPERQRFAASALLLFLWRRRRSVGASIRHEFANRYSGSMLGRLWVILFPLLFLSIYALVYTLVFRVRLPGGGVADYVLYVFSGLVPYLATMEVANQAATSVRGNLSAIRGAFLPIEIVPARIAGVAMATLAVGLVCTALLSAWTGRLSANILLLPAILLVQGLLFLGLASILAVLGALLRDIAHIVNLASLAVLFLSPIAYTEQMLPPQLWFLRDLNPVFYLVDAYRTALFDTGPVDWPRLGIFAVLSVLLFVGGAAMLRRFKGVATDNA
jgi:lipopolysaccharide transport system permease protein